MRSIQLHHGSYWFQMRVPRTQRAQHGAVVRVNLQTADRDVARVLGTTLAARWLARFSALDTVVSTPMGAHLGVGLLSAPDAATVAPRATAVNEPPLSQAAVVLPVDEARPPGVPRAEVPPHERLAALHEYWRALTPGRPERTIVEFELTAHSFDKVVGVPISKMTRADVATYRDHLLSQGLQPATVIKRLGHLSAMV